MTSTINFIRLTLITPLFFANISTAQKLPNKQQISLRAPARLKIDGIVNEWGDKLQAYNHSTQIFYAIGTMIKIFIWWYRQSMKRLLARFSGVV
jgi:hypothetical protein